MSPTLADAFLVRLPQSIEFRRSQNFPKTQESLLMSCGEDVAIQLW